MPSPKPALKRLADWAARKVMILSLALTPAPNQTSLTPTMEELLHRNGYQPSRYRNLTYQEALALHTLIGELRDPRWREFHDAYSDDSQPSSGSN